MGEALFDLEQVIRSRKDKITSHEVNILMECKGKAIRDFSIGSGLAAGVAWLVTRRFSNLVRINVAGASAISAGLWRFGGSLDSCVENILGMEGTRIQAELANILVKKYRDTPISRKLISKHFYSENVYDDSSSDQGTLRWRYRNSSGDNVVHASRANDSYGDQTTTTATTTTTTPVATTTTTATSDIKTKPLHRHQLYVNSDTAEYTSSNPFDCVFGPSVTTIDEIQQPGSSSTAPKKHSRSHRRTRRKNRMRNREDSLDLHGTAEYTSSNPFDCVFGPSVSAIDEIQRSGSSGTTPKKHS